MEPGSFWRAHQAARTRWASIELSQGVALLNYYSRQRDLYCFGAQTRPPTFVYLEGRLQTRTSWWLLHLTHSEVRGKNWYGFRLRRALVPTLDSTTRGNSLLMGRGSPSWKSTGIKFC